MRITSRSRNFAAAALSAATLAFATPTQTQGGAQCRVYEDIARLDLPLYRTGERLAGRRALTIVAIGSSSTGGAGASTPERSYPARLEAELRGMFPASRIRVVNKGLNGDTAPGMLARFHDDVLAEGPDLVLLQVGTNTVLRDQQVHDIVPHIRAMVMQLQERGIDVVLVDPQYAPKVNEKHGLPILMEVFASASGEMGVPVFRRRELMRRWHEVEGMPFSAFTDPDALHMNDWSYGCVARVMASSLAYSATQTLASIRVPR